MDRLKNWCEKHHIRHREREEIAKEMRDGLTFENAATAVLERWTEAESGDESESVELEGFRYSVEHDTGDY